MLPLEGIRVLDLSHVAPGPYCTMLLGDLGADVIRIDAPPGAMRPRGGDPGHQAVGRNKRSIILNLMAEEGRQVFYRLAQGADVFVVEEFPPGRYKSLAVDYETIHRINPRLVYCACSGYGHTGPYVNLAGHDMNFVANSGILSMIGWPDTPPAIPINIIGDFAGGGMVPALAIVSALLARQKTGRGQFIDSSMNDGAMYFLAPIASGYSASGVVPQRGQTRVTGAAPFYHVYLTRDDKWLAIGCLEPYLWNNLCKALDCQDLAPYQEDESKWPEMFQRFRAIFKTRDRDDWFAYLKEKDTCVSPVYTLDEALKDPQNVAREMVIEVDHPRLGKVTQIGIAPKFSDTPARVRAPAPDPGQHTDEVLREAGYAEAEIGRLREQGAIG